MTYIPERDSDGITIQRIKITKIGWYYQEHAIEVTSAKNDGFYNKYKDGSDCGFTSHILYDANGDVTTTEALATKTVLLWEPDHDYDIIGAQVYQSVAPASDFRIFVTAAPDYAGPSFVVGGTNLKHMGIGAVSKLDGRVAKSMLYNDPASGSGKFEFVIKHDAGIQHTIQLVIEIFKA